MSNCNQNGLVVLDRDFWVMSANAAAEEMLFCSPQPGKNCPPDRIFHESDVTRVREAIEEAFADGQPACNRVGRIRRRDRKTIFCEYTVQPLHKGTGEVIGIILSFKSAAQTTKHAAIVSSPPEGESIHGFDWRNVYQGLPQGVFTVDLKQRITSFNQAAEIITGFTCKEAMGRQCWEIFRADRCGCNCPLVEALESGKACMDREVRATDHSGAQRSFTVHVNAMRDRSGAVRGALEVFHPADRHQPQTRPTRVPGPLSEIIGESPKMRELCAVLPAVAASDAAVLICGETGTGKDLVAETIHRLSTCRQGPFVPVNCSALAETLLESELFGHEKGAFTGALQDKKGRLESAAGGTLFLDEIGELKPSLQVKLLRVLDQRCFERVGGTRPIPLKARVISATNQEPIELMRQGRFRKDLFFRLRTVDLHLPPLRSRKEDIPLLTAHFIRRHNEISNKNVRIVDPKVIRLFERYHWPGNVRELERVLAHAFVFVKGPVIFPNHLPEQEELGFSRTSALSSPPPIGAMKDRNAIRWALGQTDGNRRKAAALLGISRTSMWRRMKELEI